MQVVVLGITKLVLTVVQVLVAVESLKLQEQLILVVVEVMVTIQLWVEQVGLVLFF